MRKLLVSLVAFAAAVFATSCTNEVLPEAQLGEEAVVSFTVKAPQVASRVFGDGTSANDLYYAVYYHNQATGNEEIVNISRIDKSNPDHIDLETTVEFKLVNGNTYSIIFWAENEASVVTPDWASKTMTFNPAEANVETYDAFYAYVEPFKVSGRIDQPVELRRPFAQVNIGTADYQAAVNAGTTVTKAGITLKAFTTLNFVNGEVGGEQEIEYVATAIPDENVEKFPVAGYKYLTMNYVLVGAEKHLVSEVVFNYSSADMDYTRVYTNVPVRRNYRTNIFGNLITEDANYTIEIKPGFFEEPASHDVFHAFQYGGVVTLTQNHEIEHPLVVKAGVNAVLNLNGYTIKNNENNTDTDVIIVEEGATLTINGEGNIEAVSGNDGYAVIAKGTVVINGGTFAAGVDANGEANAIVYARGNGEIYVNGGIFLNDHNSVFVLNKRDADRATTTIEVAGGRFYNFNPADNAAEGAGTNFVKQGLSSVEVEDNVWEVKYVQDFVDCGTYAEVYTAEGLLKWAYRAQTEHTYGVKLMANIVLPQRAIAEDAANSTYVFTNEAITVTAGIPSASNWPVFSEYETANGEYVGGKVDGNGMTLSGLRLNHDLVASGFLCWTKGASVVDLTFDNAVVYNKGGNLGETYTGVVIGRCWDGSYVNNVHVKNSAVYGKNEVGGIVGRVYHRTIKSDGTVLREDLSYVVYCTTDENTTVEGNTYVGGIAGMNYGCIVGQCVNNAEVIANTCAGGVVGYHRSYTTDTDGYLIACVSTKEATVTALNGAAGGLVGYIHADANHLRTRTWIVGCVSESEVVADKAGSMIGQSIKNHGTYAGCIAASYAVTDEAAILGNGPMPLLEATYIYANAADATQADVDAMNAAIEAFNVSPDNISIDGHVGAQMLKRWVLTANGPVLQ